VLERVLGAIEDPADARDAAAAPYAQGRVAHDELCLEGRP
jgi:hypothetical protein